jgi:hypothetical protein
MMNRLRILLALLPLSVAVSVGSAAADGPGSDYGGVKVGTVRFIDPAMNLVQLDDGTELRTTDARLLRDIHVGDQVKVDFTHEGDRNMINSIEGAEPETVLGAVPAAIGGGITSH